MPLRHSAVFEESSTSGHAGLNYISLQKPVKLFSERGQGVSNTFYRYTIRIPPHIKSRPWIHLKALVITLQIEASQVWHMSFHKGKLLQGVDGFHESPRRVHTSHPVVISCCMHRNVPCYLPKASVTLLSQLFIRWMIKTKPSLSRPLDWNGQLRQGL